MRETGTEEIVYRIGLVAALVAATVCALWQFVPQEWRQWFADASYCVIYRYTGFLCPGCGGTHALAALLKGRFLVSLTYHPMVLYSIVLYLVYMASHTAGKISGALARRGMQVKTFQGLRWRDGYLWAALILLAVNFIAKNLIRLLTGVDVMAVLTAVSGL